MNSFPKKKHNWPITIFNPSLVVRETQIRATLRYHLALIRRAITNSDTNGEAVGRKEPDHAGGCASQHTHYGNPLGDSSKS